MTRALVGDPSFTIDELSAVTGVPSRTIRLYQTKGVLPRPGRKGRVSYYGPHHVERLHLIGGLQDRGFQLSAIRDLVGLGDGVTVQEWLGLGDQLAKPWSDETAARLGADETRARLAGRPPGTLAELVRTGLLRREGEGAGATYVAPSPGLLDAALALQDAGVDFDTSAAAAAILRRRLAQAVAELVRLLVGRAGDGFGRGGSPEALAAAFEGVRVTGGDATRLIFASEVERAVGQLAATGALTAQLGRDRSV